MFLWIVDGILLVGGWFAMRWMYNKNQDYPANFFGRIRRRDELQSPHRY